MCLNEELESLKRDNSTPKNFAKACFKLANQYRKKWEYEKAKSIYLEIKEEDSELVFSYASYHLGCISWFELANDDAISYLKKINEKYKYIYSRSMYLLGDIFKGKKDFDKAIEYLNKINKDNIKDFLYYKAQYFLGVITRDYLENSEKSYEYFNSSKKYFYYETKKELFCMENSNNKETINSIYRCVTDILSILKIEDDKFGYEKYVAHYTSPSVAFNLLDKNGSYLRLNTVKNVNDPKEGKILKEYLDISSTLESKHSLILISCFTFNHDSLNQFRLYGKENNLEASGVSIVFNNGFFNNQNNRINFIGNIEDKSIEDKKFIEKLPLYRCIYIDPDSKDKYINIAHRGNITFYRDGKSGDIKNYLDYIEEKNSKVIENLNKISRFIKELSFDDAKCKDEVINFLLLPITFLVKHAAFEDEQECRIIYLTDLKNKSIKTIDNKFMYIEYEYKINDYLHKIYLSSGAYKYEDFFIRLLNNDQDVCLSKNPFRNKS